MSAWIPLAVGSGLGILKYMEEKKDEPRQRKIEQTKARYYPWLGLAPQTVKSPSLWGHLGAGASQGLGVAHLLGLGFKGAEGEEGEVPVLGDGSNSLGEEEFNAYDRYVANPETDRQIGAPPAYVPPGWQAPQLTPEQVQTQRMEQSFQVRPDQGPMSTAGRMYYDPMRGVWMVGDEKGFRDRD